MPPWFLRSDVYIAEPLPKLPKKDTYYIAKKRYKVYMLGIFFGQTYS